MSETQTGARLYGNWRIPRKAGLGKLSNTATIAMFGLLIVIVIAYMSKGWVGVLSIGGVGAGALWASSIRDRHGMSLLDRGSEHVRFAIARKTKRNIYRSGPVGRHREMSGKMRLPGLLAHCELSEHEDAYGQKFALIHQGDGTVAVVLEVSPPGVQLLDTDIIDTQVALWGMWLANLSAITGVCQASVCVETVPDSGARLRRQIASRIPQDATGVAVDVIEEVVDTYGAGAAAVKTWVSVTFDPAKMGTKRSNKERVAREIASQLPGLMQNLRGGGVGAIRPLRGSELARLVRVAYDPACEEYFDKAVIQGESVSVDWENAGPVGAVSQWDHYRHDSGVSRSWVVSTPPRGAVQSRVLTPLLKPSRDVARKRVTMIFTPIDAAKAPDEIESDINHARSRVEMSRRVRQRDLNELKSAQRMAQAEAEGAGLVDFGIIITATTMSDDLADVGAAAESDAATAHLATRIAYGAQDSAFALGLPLGARAQAASVGSI